MGKKVTWPQARNCLYTGMCKRAAYDIMRSCSFCLKDNKIHRLNGETSTERSPDHPSMTFVIIE